MAKSLHLPPDAPVVFTLAALRALDFTGRVASGQHLVQGVFFAYETTGIDVLRVQSRPGSLVGFRIGETAPGKWLTLHVVLGAVDLVACKMVGFACRTRAEGPATIRVCLRSGVDSGHRDLMIGGPVVTGPHGGVHFDMQSIEDNPTLPMHAPWREVVIFFQTDTPAFTLQDFRLIMI